MIVVSIITGIVVVPTMAVWLGSIARGYRGATLRHGVEATLGMIALAVASMAAFMVAGAVILYVTSG